MCINNKGANEPYQQSRRWKAGFIIKTHAILVIAEEFEQ